VVGFDSASLSLITLSQTGGNVYSTVNNKRKSWRFCANAAHNACNWIIPAKSEEEFCVACSLNKTIPFLGKAQNLTGWQRMESAKHRLVYALLKLKLPIVKKQGEEEEGLIFEFLEDNDPERKVITQHDDGRIEININEADEVQRVKNKVELGERYRTLPGHFRHEIGHYYWDVFYKNDDTAAEKFRAVFGDERRDYDEALKQYYTTGAPVNWNDNFISAYATSHPWEDWAETWSHYLHMMDTLETAYSFGIAVNPRTSGDAPETKAKINKDPYEMDNFDDIIAQWIPLTYAVSSLNNSMGHDEFYPFVIAAPVIAKLKFIHEQVKEKSESKFYKSSHSSNTKALLVIAGASIGAIAGILLAGETGASTRKKLWTNLVGHLQNQ
jgi:hypothetical protein